MMSLFAPFGSKWNRSRFSLFRFLITTFVTVPVCLYLLLAYLLPTTPALVPPSILHSKRPVLVTAHPDDESLFFGPAVLAISRLKNVEEFRILVLSSGNNYGLGDTRKTELEEACHRIGAKECKVLDRSDLRDNPTLWWDGSVVTPIVTSWLAKWKADCVLTFDSGGISGHINHRAVSSAIIDQAENDPEFPPTFILNTVPTFFPPRKYIGILDLPMTCLGFMFRIPYGFLFAPRASEFSAADVTAWKAYDQSGLFVSSIGTWRQNVHAFWAHSSQRSWDRWLYMLVSRYMWFNAVTKVDTSKHT